jgi:hypothetical protein
MTDRYTSGSLSQKDPRPSTPLQSGGEGSSLCGAVPSPSGEGKGGGLKK